MTRAEALVLAGHGSQHHPETAAPLHAHADRIRPRGQFSEVRTAFWKEEPSLRSVASTVRSEVAYVVPVLTSEGYFADRVFPRELDAGAERTPSVELHYADPVGTHPAMTDVVLERIESMIEGPPTEAGVALVGHGTDRHARSDQATRDHAARIDGLDRYAEVCALFLDEAPTVGDLTEQVAAEEITVVPVFVADGHHTTADIPQSFGHPGVGRTAAIDGRRIHYTRAVGTEPRLADLVVDRAISAGARAEPEDDGKPAGPAAGADEAFLAWVEAGDGRRRWGELAIDRGRGGFELRHADDARVDCDQLQRVDDRSALRRRVRRDDRGRYRPLSGERSLPAGWVVDGLDGEGLVRAVRAVYPGSVADWYHSRTDGLSTTPFRETAARQTGEYAALASMDGAEVRALTEVICGNCVRRREWPVDTEELRNADQGDSHIPCREACPFVLSAAAEIEDVDGATADREDPDVPIAAVEEPANRYRVRYAEERAERAPATVPAGGDG